MSNKDEAKNLQAALLQKVFDQETRQRDEVKKLIIAKELPEARAMTRKERKELDAAGLNVRKVKKDDTRDYSEIEETMCDWILDNIYQDVSFNHPNYICNAFAKYVYALTYGDDVAVKNS